jgi:hypothetical protein
MKTLLLTAFLIVGGGLFISATKKDYRSELNRDEIFTKNIISELASLKNSGNDIEFNVEFTKLAKSIALLQEKYPDLNNSTTGRLLIDKAMDKLAKENRAAIHGDTCLRQFVHAVFACFRVCTTQQALKACFTAACTSYQACKEGGER